jgi:hypothetical protein
LHLPVVGGSSLQRARRRRIGICRGRGSQRTPSANACRRVCGQNIPGGCDQDSVSRAPCYRYPGKRGRRRNPRRSVCGGGERWRSQQCTDAEAEDA